MAEPPPRSTEISVLVPVLTGANTEIWWQGRASHVHREASTFGTLSARREAGVDPDSEPWRALTTNEAALLSSLTSLDYEGSAELKSQIGQAEARRGCDCGCGTVDLRVSEGAVASAADTTTGVVRGQAEILTAEPCGQLVLFVEDGFLSRLELIWYDEPLQLPTPAEIRTFLLDA